MALTGACTGTVLVQLPLGIPSGWTVAAGGLIGGIFYSRYARYRASSTIAGSSPTGQASNPPTIHGKYNLKESHAILAFEVFCAAVVLLATTVLPRDSDMRLNPIVGGLMIGGSQATSLLLTGNMLGVSTAYEQCGNVFWWLYDSIFKPSSTVDAEGKGPKRPEIRSVIFAAGIMAGAWTLTRWRPVPLQNEVFHVSLTRAILGGFMLVVGARIAGGCTSGHGISGMSSLSISSFVTVAAMFGGGMGLAAVLG